MPGAVPARLCENSVLMLPLDLNGPFPGVRSSVLRLAMLAMAPCPPFLCVQTAFLSRIGTH